MSLSQIKLASAHGSSRIFSFFSGIKADVQFYAIRPHHSTIANGPFPHHLFLQIFLP